MEVRVRVFGNYRALIDSPELTLELDLLPRLGAASLTTMWLAALLCIQGALSFRWVVLRAGVYVPPGY